MTERQMDGSTGRKLGDRESMRSSGPGLSDEEEWFLFVNASIRMTDESACDRPYSMEPASSPHETGSGDRLIPESTIGRKRFFIVTDTDNRRLIGKKLRIYDRKNDTMHGPGGAAAETMRLSAPQRMHGGGRAS